MTKRSFALATLIVVGSVGSASAGIPAWCKVEGKDKLDHYGLDKLYSNTDARYALRTIVGATCFPDSDTESQAKQIEATRQAWGKKLDMLEADWADAFEWAYESNSYRDIQPKQDKRAWTDFSPIDQYAELLMQIEDHAYDMDAWGAKVTETGRFAYILRCIGPGASYEHDPARAVTWAMCAADIAAFDRKKLAAEVRADTRHNGSERMLVRLALWEATPAFATHAADVKAVIAKDPGYEKMFAIAETTARSWTADPAVLALATKMDDARITDSRRATEGCVGATWAAWSGVIKKLPAKLLAPVVSEPGYRQTEVALLGVLGTPDGYLAALAVVQCARLTETADTLGAILGSLMQRWPGQRGPRNAVQTALMTSGIKLDDRKAEIEYPSVSRDWMGGITSISVGVTGSVAKLEAAGAETTITFAKEKVVQTVCVKGHETNRMIQIRSDGGIVYEYVCDQQKTETIYVPPSPPLEVRSRFAQGLKAGMIVRVDGDTASFAFAKGTTTLVLFTGVALK